MSSRLPTDCRLRAGPNLQGGPYCRVAHVIRLSDVSPTTEPALTALKSSTFTCEREGGEREMRERRDEMRNEMREGRAVVQETAN